MSARLDELIPDLGFPSPDAMLEAFLGWVGDQGLSLYAHQEEAILELYTGRHVVLDAPTGSGKSLVATALHFKTFAELGRTWYTAPIKALVSEKFFALCRIFGPEHVGMITGDGAVNRDAPIICCTAEILANLALREGEDAKVHSVVMDEFHYYGDRDRGMAWQIPLLLLPRTTFLLMSATLGDTTAIREDLERRTGRPVSDVRGVHRPVPLVFEYSKRPLHDAIADVVRGGRAPAYVVHFTQNDATDQAQALMSLDWCTKEEKRALADAVGGVRFTSPFGPTLKRYLLHGVGLHHAGLLPRYRLLVERLAQQGLLKIICGTDTLGVGINVPIRTVLLTQLCKFDGAKVEILKVREFRQIAGRAGRAGFDTQGYVVVQAPAHIIDNELLERRITDPKKLRKTPRAQPPARGYKHWDEDTFRRLTELPPEPLAPQFRLDHGRLLMVLQHAQEHTGSAGPGVEALLSLVERAHLPPAERERQRELATSLLEDLRAARIVGYDGDTLHLDPELPTDFSLFHPLSLLLVDALRELDPTADAHALDVVTWVEAILEDPRAILLKQQDRDRGHRLQELRAAGVPYEERIAALEDISWPKPHGDELYAFHEEYAAAHPWVRPHPVHPKSIAREMAEVYSSFADYIRDLSLTRSEGVLLRYLTEVYKALLQNVPPEARSPTLLDVIGYLRAMLALVDSSLVQEWESMLYGQALTPEAPVDISADRKLFYARLRAELHALLRALARGDWEEASASLRVAGEGEEAWGPAAWEPALAPALAELGALGFDARARHTEHNSITPTGPHQWEVRLRLLPPLRPDEEEDDLAGWTLVARVDLRGDANPEGPLLRMVGIEG